MHHPTANNLPVPCTVARPSVSDLDLDSAVAAIYGNAPGGPAPFLGCESLVAAGVLEPDDALLAEMRGRIDEEIRKLDEK